jgi:hypothetical protein
LHGYHVVILLSVKKVVSFFNLYYVHPFKTLNLSGAIIAPTLQFHLSPMLILLLPVIKYYQVGVILSVTKFTPALLIESVQI